MLTPVKAGVTITPLLTVGDVIRRLPVRGHPGRHLGADRAATGRVDLYVNHETSKVPFPYNPAWTPIPARRRATSTTHRSAS